MDMFNKENFNYLNDLILLNINTLNESNDYKNTLSELNSSIEYFEEKLEKDDKVKFRKLVKTFYKHESFIEILSYMLGVKYHKNLKKLKNN